MSLRAIFIGIVALAAIGIANIIFMMRGHQVAPVAGTAASAASAAQPPGQIQAASSPTALASVAGSAPVASSVSPVAAVGGAPAKVAPVPPRAAPELASGFVLERQTLSPSKNLRVSYWRDRKEKVRRITLEDARQAETKSVLHESKGNAWALVSPDDQWIALDDRSNPEASGVRLYHRRDQGVQFEPADSADRAGQTTQDTIWHTYLDSTRSDPATPRRQVTIDATAWEADAHTLGVSVAYVHNVGETDVPEPWRCNYDVATNKVQPLDQAEESTQTSEPGPTAEQPTATQNETSADANGDAETADTELPGEKFPATRLEELTVPDVNESSASEIAYAINEMFARHGADFTDKKQTKVFSQFSWYQPRPGVPLDQIESDFSDLEKQNLNVLKRCRDAKRVAARRGKTRAVRGQQVQPDSSGAEIFNGILQGVLNNLPN